VNSSLKTQIMMGKPALEKIVVLGDGAVGKTGLVIQVSVSYPLNAIV
jgi:GTPase SAR1 family protein